MSNPYGPIDYGRDLNYFKKLTVSDVDFPNTCQVVIPFMTYTITFDLESGGPLEYSFNGLTLHGDMTAGESSESLVFENRVASKIWFRGTGVVRIEAWSIR